MNAKELRSHAKEMWDSWARTSTVPPGDMAESILESGSFDICELEKDPFLVLNIHWMLRWYAYGYPTFELTGGLGAALLMTECRGVKCEDLRMPLSALLIQLPSPSPIVHPTGDVKTILAGVCIINGIRCINLTAWTDSIYSHCSTAWPCDYESLEEWVTACDTDTDLHYSGPRADKNTRTAMIRLFANFCLYVNSIKSTLSPQPGAVTATRTVPGVSTLPVRWVIGREIKLSKQIAQTSRAYCQLPFNERRRAGFRLHSRFVVRGHWRNQAFGKGRAGRKLRWIEPFWKGPEMAEGLARLYSVEQNNAS